MRRKRKAQDEKGRGDSWVKNFWWVLLGVIDDDGGRKEEGWMMDVGGYQPSPGPA
jgi:hypothetical protein